MNVFKVIYEIFTTYTGLPHQLSGRQTQWYVRFWIFVGLGYGCSLSYSFKFYISVDVLSTVRLLTFWCFVAQVYNLCISLVIFSSRLAGLFGILRFWYLIRVQYFLKTCFWYYSQDPPWRPSSCINRTVLEILGLLVGLYGLIVFYGIQQTCITYLVSTGFYFTYYVVLSSRTWIE